MRRSMLLLPLLTAGAPPADEAVDFRVEVDAAVTWDRAGQVRRDSITMRAVVSIAFTDSLGATWARFTISSASFREWTLGTTRPPIARDLSTGRSFLRRIVPGKHPTVVWTGERIPWSPALGYLMRPTRQEKGVRRLELELRRPDAPAETTTLTLSRSSRSIRHLWTLLRSRLERIDLRAGVEGVVLHAARTARLRHEQMNSLALGGSANKVSQAAWGELVDNLTDRLGPARVLCIDAAESHLPECAWKERPALEDPPRFRSAVTPADRPSRLYPRPEPAEAIALTPDGPVFDLSWRSRRWRVLACAGPERLGPEWWRWSRPSHVADPRSQRTRTSRPMPPDRDYFALQLETGLWVWACRQLRTRRWFVHGEWS